MEEKKRDSETIQEDGEFMLAPVPLDKRRRTYDQVMVWVGFGYVVTGLFVGGVLGGYQGQPGLPPGQAVWAVILGMGSLFLITSFLGIAAQKTGFNLSLLSRYSYGRQGIALPMAVMALLTLGWFASITGMIGDIYGAFIGNPTGVIMFDPSKLGYSGIPPITLEVFIACMIWGIVFTITAVKGMGAIEWIAKLVAPLILLAAIVAGVVFLNQAGGLSAFWTKASHLSGLGLGRGITVVVGSWIAGAVMGVDLFRFNKNVHAVFLGAAACFIFTNPILNFVGYIGAAAHGEFNYVIWMLGVSLPVALLGVFVWTTSLWTTNNSELYCNALYTGPVLDSFNVKVNRKKLVTICGIVGTIIGSLAFYQMFFATFIGTLGAMAPPLAAPILADYFIVRREKYSGKVVDKQPNLRWAGIISFVIGAILGFLFEFVIPLPFGLPSGLAAMLITFVLYILIYRFTPDKNVDDSLITQLG
jgi:cytosine permease